MLRSILAATCVGILTAGCASTYESRIRSSLIEAGLPPSLSGCMAERMVDRLSYGQLNSLTRLSVLRRDAQTMRVDEFLNKARSLVDPEVYAVITSAGLGCAISGQARPPFHPDAAVL